MTQQSTVPRPEPARHCLPARSSIWWDIRQCARAMSNVTCLPTWKKNATAAERFDELANLARSDESQFEKVVVIWGYEHKGSRRVKHLSLKRDCPSGMYAEDFLGLLEVAKFEIIAGGKE